MISSAIIIKSLLSCFVLIGLFFVTGRGLDYLVLKSKNRKQSSHFEAILTGFLMIISAYAIIITKGVTVLFPIPFLLILSKNIETSELNSDNIILQGKKDFVFIIIGLSLYFLYYLQAFIFSDSETIKYASGDSSFYARLAEYINQTGVENWEIDYLNPTVYKPEVYHYGDIWLPALIAKFTGLNTHFALILVSYPLLAMVFILGFFEIATRRFGRGIIVFIISLLCVLFSGIGKFYPSFLLKSDIYDVASASFAKCLLPGSIILYCLIAIGDKRRNDFLIFSICGCLAFITSAPAFALFAFIALLFWLIQRKVSFCSLIPSLSAGLLTTIFFYFFYKNGLSHSVWVSESVISYAKKACNILVAGTFQFCILFPIILLLGINAKDIWKNFNLKNDILLIFLLSFLGLFSWALLWPATKEIVQFFSMIFLPASSIITGLVLIYCFTRKELVYKCLVIAFVAFLVIRKHNYDFHIDSVSKEDFIKAKEFLGKYNENYFANIRDTAEFKTITSMNTQVYLPLPWLSYLQKKYQNPSLNTPYLVNNTAQFHNQEIKKTLQSTPFYMYTSKHNLNDTISMQMEFIKEKHIGFLTVSPLARLSDKFSTILLDSIQLSTGWNLYKVK